MCRVLYYAEGRTTLLGGVFAGGLGYYGTANVAGSVMAVVTDTIFDENAIGVVLGSMAEHSVTVENTLQALLSCPNCHRRLHAINDDQMNAVLQERAAKHSLSSLFPNEEQKELT